MTGELVISFIKIQEATVNVRCYPPSLQGRVIEIRIQIGVGDNWSSCCKVVRGAGTFSFLI